MTGGGTDGRRDGGGHRRRTGGAERPGARAHRARQHGVRRRPDGAQGRRLRRVRPPDQGAEAGAQRTSSACSSSSGRRTFSSLAAPSGADCGQGARRSPTHAGCRLRVGRRKASPALATWRSAAQERPVHCFRHPQRGGRMIVWSARQACGTRSRRVAAGLGEALRTPPGGATVGRNSAHVSSFPRRYSDQRTTRYPEAGYMSRHFWRACDRAAGFSFVELLVTIIIAGIAFAAMVPVFVQAQQASSGDKTRRHRPQRRAGPHREDPSARLRAHHRNQSQRRRLLLRRVRRYLDGSDGEWDA